jgi:hypothetical protein
VAGEGFVGVNFGGPFQWPDDTGTVEALRVEVFMMTFVQGVKYGLFPPVAFRQWGHARRVRSRRLCALSVRGRSSAPMPSKASLA